MDFIPSEIIELKKQGKEHSPEQIEQLIQAYVRGDIKDYHMSAWAMAVYFNGMTPKETAAFTKSMIESGSVFDFSNLDRPVVDKHSTGGVGDKTSLILAPIVACAGVAVPMISGRGLGHTGGTLDKLESIPGFRVHLSKEEFSGYLREHGMAMMGQSEDICPADKKFYSLRDVTATIDSIPLICGSIMSKKIAEGISGLVLDVKFGSGAFMKTPEMAEQLAMLLKSTGELHNLSVSVLLTSMNRPLGRFAGNTLEVFECVEIMAGNTYEKNGVDLYEDTRELSLQLAAHMIWAGGKASSADEGYKIAQEILESGQALKAFEKLCEYQGPSSPYNLAEAPYTKEVVSPQEGYLAKFDTGNIGWASLELGAGRKKVDDKIDPVAGLEFYCKLGQKVKKGDPIIKMYSSHEDLFPVAEDMLLNSIEIHPEPVTIEPLITKVL